jgi:hypothetical protein
MAIAMDLPREVVCDITLGRGEVVALKGWPIFERECELLCIVFVVAREAMFDEDLFEFRSDDRQLAPNERVEEAEERGQLLLVCLTVVGFLVFTVQVPDPSEERGLTRSGTDSELYHARIIS